MLINWDTFLPLCSTFAGYANRHESSGAAAAAASAAAATAGGATAKTRR